MSNRIFFIRLSKILFIFGFLIMSLILAPTVKAVADIEAPSAPQSLSIQANTDTTVTLSWIFSIDNSMDQMTYTVYVDGNAKGTTTSTTFTITGLSPLTTYAFTAKANDSSGNTSALSNVLTAGTTEDRVPPKIEILYPLNNASVDGAVTFTASSSDDVLLTGLQFILDDQNFSSVLTASPFTVNFDSGYYTPGSPHRLKVLAYDSSGNIGTASVYFIAGKPTASAPLAIQPTQITNNSAVIIWQTTNGTIGTVKYGLSTDYNLQTQENSYSTIHSVTLTGLASSTTYNYSVLSNGTGYTTASSSNYTFTTSEFAPVDQLITSTGNHPDGTLILDGSTVYLIKSGSRTAFRDEAEYKSYGYNFTQAVNASSQDKDLPQTGILKAMEGSLVLDKADGKTVFMVGTGATKRGFSSAQVFTDLGYVFKDLTQINMSDYQTGPAINSASQAHPDGALVLDNKTVWWIRGNIRQGFESEAVFNTYGFSFSKIVPANSADLQLAQGANVKFRDGTLVKDGNDYFIISNEKKLKFSSDSQLTSKGYKLSNVLSASLTNYESGGNIN